MYKKKVVQSKVIYHCVYNMAIFRQIGVGCAKHNKKSESSMQLEIYLNQSKAELHWLVSFFWTPFKNIHIIVTTLHL